MASVTSVVKPPPVPLPTPSTLIRTHIPVIPTITPVFPTVPFVTAIPMASAQRRPRPTAPAAFCAFTVANIIAWTINKRFLPL